jgi:molybdopterin-containing oxidoreductase family iron-sulfur binding subunit
VSDNQVTESDIGSRKYWQSLEEWRQDPEFKKILENEFIVSPLAAAEAEGRGAWARREFLQLMGASLALTSFGCVRRPAQKIVPYVQRPQDVVEGIANYYSSSFSDGSEGFGLVVTTREGRPIKVDGNPLHPSNEGGMSARSLAHILSLYDPDRLNKPTQHLQNGTRSNRDTVAITHDVAFEAIGKALKSGKWAILTPSIVSPSQKALLEDFTGSLQGKHYTYDSMGAEVFSEAQALSFGTKVTPRLVLDRARYILAINADILGTYLTPTESQKQFGRGRKADDKMNKLVVIESLLTLTGTNADERYRIRPSQSADILALIAHELIVREKKSRFASSEAVQSVLKGYREQLAEFDFEESAIKKIALELWANRTQSLVVAGEDMAAQVLANLLNVALENDGQTIDYGVSPNTGFKGSSSNLYELIQDIESGKITTLLVYGVNPAYASAEALGFSKALAKLKLMAYFGTHNDETGHLADYVIPIHHPMENWGDLEAQQGVFSIQQPTIQPLGDTRAFEDALIEIAKISGSSRLKNVENWYAYLRSQWQKRLPAPFEKNWIELLKEGVKTTVDRKRTLSVRAFNVSALSVLKAQRQPVADFELELYQSVGMRDGSMANISWLQEFPDVISKICWDNYASVSPKTAIELKLKEGQVIELESANQKISVPVHIQPGQADRVIGLALGYGRTACGGVGNNVGVNAYKLATAQNGRQKFSALPVIVKATKTRERLADTGGHHSMMGRQIVVEATLNEYKASPSANIHRHKIFSAWSGHKYTGHKWGMTIDLSSCTGCSACVIACQSENNIPVVGKQRTLQGREMHWLRVDRYHVGDPNDPNTVFMPVMCQHCDNAPCETVCPVAATVHSTEGTNDMIYNRCVGTRYCSNNCPYKVRRFNYFEYANFPSPLNLALNPEVTVRSRGVMEKCTFCTHKIKDAKNKARVEDRAIRDGDVISACQAACPTGAIVFGDVNDPNSRVSQSLKEERNYRLLEELNVLPAVSYKSKIRNTDKLKADLNKKRHGGGHGKAKNEGHA